MRLLQWFVTIVFISAMMFGQAGSGTITGTVTDPTGAVVANASVEAKNTETGVVYPAQTTSSGNYTLSQLPPPMSTKTTASNMISTSTRTILFIDPPLAMSPP